MRARHLEINEMPTDSLEEYIMVNKCNFIITNDKETADKLIQHGMRLLSDINGVYTFENKAQIISFSEIDMKKVVYTNMLSL